MSPSRRSRDERYPSAVMYENIRDAALLPHGINHVNGLGMASNDQILKNWNR